MAFTVRSILPNHAAKPDFNGDGFTDLIWRGADGSLAVWNMRPDGLSGTPGLYIAAPAGLELRGIGDIQGNGTTDLIWQDAAGQIETWAIQDNQVGTVTPLGGFGTTRQIRMTGDFSGDGHSDLLWFNPPSASSPDGSWSTASAEPRKIPPLGLGQLAPFSIDFQLVGVGDFDGDGRDDILFRGTGNATVGVFRIEEPRAVTPGGPEAPTQTVTFADPGPSWAVLGLADFDGDGRTDILWQHTNATGQVDTRTIWGAQGGELPDPGADWSLVGTDDYNNDGRADLMWKHMSGWYAEWFMDGAKWLGVGATFASNTDFWQIGAI
ncbi:VCBS repeat-containing protein [Dankookia rubra]|uniref:VCBS repeat-containing protein n=1 Tax=Dankookia rubra TaxID=1442381 RepID=A0A4R5QF81_9PROT|nr:VCBS repeat-containing protein [Dankookia rubra]TDH61097.1 VCBS repeat-containing protein [Dankookia rubra]